jgi:hypothetical protein
VIDLSPRTPARETRATMPAASALIIGAYVLVTIGSCLRGDVLFLLGVPLTMAGFAVACVAATRMTWRRTWPVASIAPWLAALAAVGLASPSLHGATWYDVASRAYFALAILLVGWVAGESAVRRTRAVTAIVTGAILLQVATPFGIRAVIDVWSWTDACTRALLHGIHPYTVVAPDLQQGGFDFGTTPALYPYMPVTLLVSAPWVALVGDYRLGLACCLPATIVMLRAAGRRLAVDAAVIDLVTLALVLHPMAAAITAAGYMEPVLIAVSSAFLLFAAARPAGYGEAAAFLLLPAIKQYVAAPLLLYMAMRRRPRAIAAGTAIAAATIVPFLLWRWRPTIEGMLFFIRAPLAFRVDSDSAAAMVAVMSGVKAPRALSVATQFAVAAIAWPLARDRGIAGLLLASALSMIASFLTATQAFTNYYDFAGALLLLSALASARPAAAPVTAR